MTIILEIKRELKELKVSRYKSSSSSNPKRSKNTKLIISQKYSSTNSYNLLYYGKEYKFLVDNYQSKVIISNTIQAITRKRRRR